MRKKFLTMFLVGAMALSITACGGKETEETNNTANQPIVEQNVEENVANDNQQETVVENTGEEVLEGDAPIDETVDSGMSGVESIDLSNTTVLNVAEKFSTTIELPVYTFAYRDDTDRSGYFKANNISDEGVVNEVYSLKITPKKKGISAADAYTFISGEYTKMNESGKYSIVEMNGNENSITVLAAIDLTTVNGSSLEIIDVYYIYDATTSNVYELNLAIAKNSALYGENVLEKSTADYREQLRDAVLALAN